MINRLIYLLGVLFFFSACQNKESNQIENICPEVFEASHQIMIGAAIQPGIAKDVTNFPILDRATHSQAYAYLDQLFNTVLDTEPITTNRAIYNWNLNIVKNDAVQMAFFLPGGEFYIYTGLLKFLESEHQLLAIMAHELYYVNTDLIPIAIRDAEFIDCFELGDITLGREVSNAESIAVQMPQLAFDEISVMNADSFAVAILCPFLYEPIGLREVIQKAENSGEGLDWLTFRNASIGTRQTEIVRLAENCDLGGVRNEAAYLDFLENNLP